MWEEEVKIVVLDNGSLMAMFDDGSLTRIKVAGNGVYINYPPKDKE